ncbi:MAG: hypothetical protein WAV45_13465, partial [Propionibacteriaceae bacterium]
AAEPSGDWRSSHASLLATLLALGVFAASVSGLQGHGCGGWVLIVWCLALLLAAALWGWPYFVLPMPGVKDRSV